MIIAGAVDLSLIPDKKYDFVMSSNNLEHIANPMKALLEIISVVKDGGHLLVVVPKKDTNFDHRRAFTSFEHCLQDYWGNVGEDDLTHLPEIVEKHDYDEDLECGGKYAFYERGLRNIEKQMYPSSCFL